MVWGRREQQGETSIPALWRALEGEPLQQWNKVTKNNRAFTKEAFQNKLYDLVEELLDEDVYDDQLKYLQETEKPKAISASEWMDRIEVLASASQLIKKGATEMDEETIIKKVITKNLPSDYAKDFIMQGGDKKKRIKDVKKLLRTIERANNFDIKAKLQQQQELKDQQRLRQQLKKNEKPEKEVDTSNNYSTGKCRLQGHVHEWSECQNNPRSTNYNGTHYAMIREKERNKSNNNKTGSEHNMIQGGGQGSAPAVTFHEDAGDFDFDDDESDTIPKGEPM